MREEKSMNEVIRSMELSGNLSEEQNEALNLHYEIIAKATFAAASAMVDFFARTSKRMRDERKYLYSGTRRLSMSSRMSVSSSDTPIHIYKLSSRSARNICSRMQVSESRSSEHAAALPWYERKEVEEK